MKVFQGYYDDDDDDDDDDMMFSAAPLQSAFPQAGFDCFGPS